MMSSTPQVIPRSPPPPIVEPASSEEAGVVPLDEDLVMDVYTMSFDEFERRIIQAHRKHFPDDHASPSFVRERVIVSNIGKASKFHFRSQLGLCRSKKIKHSVFDGQE